MSPPGSSGIRQRRYWLWGLFWRAATVWFWIPAFLVMGIGCMVNAARCGSMAVVLVCAWRSKLRGGEIAKLFRPTLLVHDLAVLHALTVV